jgi:hypothetical protein
MTDNQTVDRLDLIIQALEKYIAFTPSFYDVGKEALDAARELKELKPVGEFMIAADINGKNCYIQVEEKDTFTFSLYALEVMK